MSFHVSDLVCELPKSTLPAGSAIAGGQYVFYVSGPTPLRCDYACRNGDALILSTGGNAAVHFGEGPFSYSTDCWAIEPIQGKVEGKFLYYHLSSQIACIDALGFEGSGLRHLRKNFIRHYPVPDFPLCEQTEIAEVLSTVDRAIEQTQGLIAKQQRIKTGLMQDLLTRGIDEHGNLRSEDTHQFKDSPLGRIPVEWEVVAVEQLGDIVTGTTPSTAEASFYDGDVMFISPKDVSHEADLILDTEKKLSNKGLCVCRTIPKNSICTVCIGSTIGKMGISIAKCATNQQINTLVPHEEKDAEMLYFSMNLFLPTQLRREAGLQAVPIVNKAVFSRMQLPVPKDGNEKDRIRTALASPSGQIAAQTKVHAKLCSLKTALMQDLLTGKVRVTPLLTEPQEAST